MITNLVTVDVAAAMLCISKRKMYDMAAPRGPIPCYKLSARIIRFDLADIKAYIDARKVMPFDPVHEAGQARFDKSRLKIRLPGEMDESLRKVFKKYGITPTLSSPRKRLK